MKEINDGGISQIQVLTDIIINNLNNKEMNSIKFILAFIAAFGTFAMILSLIFELNNMNSADLIRLVGYSEYSCCVVLFCFYLIKFKRFILPFKIVIGLLGYLFTFLLITLGLREINFDAGSSLLVIIPYLLFATLSSSIILYLWIKLKKKTLVAY